MDFLQQAPLNHSSIWVPGDLGQPDRLNLEKAPGGISKANIGCSVVATLGQQFAG